MLLRQKDVPALALGQEGDTMVAGLDDGVQDQPGIRM